MVNRGAMVDGWYSKEDAAGAVLAAMRQNETDTKLWVLVLNGARDVVWHPMLGYVGAGADRSFHIDLKGP
jgi:hypothetical protein